jgi:magnesium-transporting ATPase (P-type)
MRAKKIVSDMLFVIQIVGALVFCGAYFFRSLHDVKGSSLVQFGLVATYLLFHLALGVGAHRASPSRITRQAIFTYTLWFVLISAVFIVTGTNAAYRWNDKETAQLLTASILTVIVLATAIVQHKKLSDPMAKGLFAIAYKSVPQLLLAWKFVAEGASGTPGLSVIMGHFTILIRLGQIYFMVREAGWDRNRIWLATSETLNEISWIIASTAWLLVS